MECLMQFHSAGSLDHGLCSGQRSALRRQVQSAIEAHRFEQTPYGPLVQRMNLGTEALSAWECIDPCAYLHVRTSISSFFATLMRDCVRDATTPLRLVICIDEVNPGNPLRPDQRRSTHAIYWSFADWPAWALQRASM